MRRASEVGQRAGMSLGGWRPGLPRPDVVRDEPTAAVVAVHCSDHVHTAVSIAADVEEASIRRQPYRMQPAVAVDEGDSGDIVARDAVEEAVA